MYSLGFSKTRKWFLAQRGFLSMMEILQIEWQPAFVFMRIAKSFERNEE
jgi:hypothetical protein